MENRGRRIHAIEKALHLLDCFWAERRPLSLSELEKMTGWAKSTIHGLLASMLDSGVVEQDSSDGRYRLGYHLFELGNAVNQSWDVPAICRRHLQSIVDRFHESAYLARLSGDELLLAICEEPHTGFRITSEEGTRLPLHCTSQGKVFLSAMADHEAKRVLPRRTLEPYTPKTLVTWEKLFRVMQAARENGYAVEEGEYRFGLCSPSAPVRDSSGAVRYAVGFVGMFDSVRSPDFQRDIDLTCAAAAQISTALGYRA